MSLGVEIVPCPGRLVSEALSLALSPITPEQRREIAPSPLLDGPPLEDLVVAIKDGELCGATWIQRQPGNTAIVWPPQLVAGCGPEIAGKLAHVMADALDHAGIRFAQVVLPNRQTPIVPVLEAVGFQF